MRTFKQAIWMFGGLDLGLDLPKSAETQLQKGQVWDVATGPDAAPNSWGGHSVDVVGYDATGVCVLTWGRRQWLTWAFVHAYCSESWACLSGMDWLRSDKSPDGFNMAQLQSDLATLKAS